MLKILNPGLAGIADFIAVTAESLKSWPTRPRTAETALWATLRRLWLRFSWWKLVQVIERSPSDGRKVISFSLYGDDDRYFAHLENVVLSYREHLSEYTPRFYVARDVGPEVLRMIKSHGCEVVRMKAAGVDSSYMFWRFLAADDSALTHVLVRDIDAGCGPDEAMLVSEWEKSGKSFHIIRSHYSHNALIMGGLWAVRPGKLAITSNFSRVGRIRWGWGRDQIYLARHVYPHVKDDALIHDVTEGFPGEEGVIPIKIDTSSFSWVSEPMFERGLQEARREFKRQHQEWHRAERTYREPSPWI